MYILTGGERILGRVIFKISVGFVTSALILLAVSLYLSNSYLQEQQRLAQTGHLESALDTVEWAAWLDPFSSVPLASKAYLELQQGNTELAAEAFGEAIKRDPANYRNYEALGGLQRQQLGDPDAAAETYRQALERNPHATAVVSRLGEALLSSGDLEGAKAQYEWLQERGKIPLKDLYTLGKTQIRLGEPETAIETFEKAKQRAGTELKTSDQQQQEQRRAFLDSLDLAIADALVVQGLYIEARDYLSQSDAEQAPVILTLLDEDPEGYRKSVLDAPIN
jgi:tetratricopeptide (TPR) repeat protein